MQLSNKQTCAESAVLSLKTISGGVRMRQTTRRVISIDVMDGDAWRTFSSLFKNHQGRNPSHTRSDPLRLGIPRKALHGRNIDSGDREKAESPARSLVSNWRARERYLTSLSTPAYAQSGSGTLQLLIHFQVDSKNKASCVLRHM